MGAYYRLLNCGFKLPVSGGTASGVKPSPLGYDRVYVHLSGPFTYRNWFRELKAGHSFATNGPMLFLTVNGHQPGDTIQFSSDTRGTNLRVHAEVDSVGALDRLEILWKGKVIKQVSAPPNTHKLNADIAIPVGHTGWFVARAFEKPTKTERFAHTSPVYVQVGHDRRIVPGDAMYFVRLMDREIMWNRNLSGFRTDADRQAMVNMYREAKAVYAQLATSSAK